MSFPAISQLADARVPPHAESGHPNEAKTLAVTTSSQDLDLSPILSVASAATGLLTGRWISLQPRGSNVYFRAKAALGGTTVTSGAGSNGAKIVADDTQDFFFASGTDNVIEIIGDAACTLLYWPSDRKIA